MKLLAAAVVGAVVGIERERRDRPAGLRTHILVCVGSTLIMLVSIDVAGSRADPGRIAAQIVTGIGFLGAGTIFRSGGSVRGLTTAAGLWVVAGIGMAIGMGGDLLWLGVIVGVLISIINWGLLHLENRWVREVRDVDLKVSRGHVALGQVLECLGHVSVQVQRVQWITNHQERDRVRLTLRLPAGVDADSLTGMLTAVDAVEGVEWQ